MTALSPRGATVARLLATLATAAALVILVFVGYLQWGTAVHTDRAQQRLDGELRRPAPTTASASPVRERPPRRGQPVARLRIPTLGTDYRYVVVEGTSAEELRDGPGHFPGSALPGQLGNFAVAGHRTTYGAPFNRIDELRRGDVVVVETATTRYVYAVTTTKVVAPTDVGVAFAVPGRPHARPDRRLITLTTCHPEYSARERLVVHGELVTAQPRS